VELLSHPQDVFRWWGNYGGIDVSVGGTPVNKTFLLCVTGRLVLEPTSWSASKPGALTVRVAKRNTFGGISKTNRGFKSVAQSPPLV